MTLPVFIRPGVCLLLFFAAQAAWGAPDYEKEIKPLLKARCYACHGALKQKAGLRLDTVALMHKGGDSGDVIEHAAPEMVARVSSVDKDERMPPEGAPLNAEEVARLKDWVSSGAAAPADEKPEPDPRLHWAYQIPKTAASASAREAVDTLLAARLREKGLTPQPEAPPEVWLRRVYLDLIGLPPSAEETRHFFAEYAAGAAPAMERTVDRLLATPAYGERWGRHFMDIWRYSDWYGLNEQLRVSQKHIWHWRDWIVESLNADKGYDRMIVEMLAADEAVPEDRDALRATGFLCRNYFLFNRTTWLDETIEHTSRAFLGVTMQCTKCHDHKYDPVSQVDYYKMRAVFEPYHVRLDPVPGETDLAKDGLPRVYDLHLDQPTYVHRKGNEKDEDKSRVMAPGVPEVIAFGEFKPEPVSLPAAARQPGLWPFVYEDQMAQALKDIGTTGQGLVKAREWLEVVADDETESGYRDEAEAELEVAEKIAVSAKARVEMLRVTHDAELAQAAQPAPATLRETMAAAARASAELELARADRELAKARLAMLTTPAAKNVAKNLETSEAAFGAAMKKAQAPGDKYELLRASLKAQEGPEDKANATVQTYPATSSGRRLAFAQWIANERNPLTARVLVNHVWLRHFGASLVPDVTDFGRRCPPPLHQDVLDTLATAFMQHGWSMKYLHRELVLSQLYRRSSSNAAAAPATLQADPDNACYWRMNPRRLESQAVRDSLLQTAGLLDHTIGGPSVDAEKASASLRRSIYFGQTADVEERFLGAFDNSNIRECYRRQESIVPQQALAMANSKLTWQCAEALAQKLAALPEPEFVDEAFLALLTRRPSNDERAACQETLAELAARGSKQARALLLQALMNHNDFITLR